MNQEMIDSINELLKDTQDAIDSFDSQIELVGSTPFPIELYELLCKLHSTTDVLCVRVQELAEKIKHQQAAIDELTERLGDEISSNINKSVELRVRREDEVAAANQAAADAFIDEAIAKLFNPPTTDPTTDEGARA